MRMFSGKVFASPEFALENKSSRCPKILPRKSALTCRPGFRSESVVFFFQGHSLVWGNAVMIA
ncbi:hypothetical protein BDD14_4541 [Edaphobacter modestus]|uniref:Uncharacterized protein n=1 Tax=Edaphobacter modestus TaxID=388466 RepID=A0A4Q7YYR2_9BACT|nr:hypothetical protein BDD14_4541 [Edaphobacter modestus]